MYRMHLLSPSHESVESLSAFALLVHPDSRQALFRSNEACQGISLGISFLGRPIGAVVAGPAHSNVTRINSLYIVPEFRGRGLATKLLKALQYEVQNSPEPAIYVDVALEHESPEKINRLLARLGWQPIEEKIRISIGTNFSVPSMRWNRTSTSRLPVGYSLHPWSSVTAAEQRELRKEWSNSSQNRFALINPFKDVLLLDLDLSLCLRKEGEVVGWMVVQRQLPNLVVYSSLYVREGEKGRHPGAIVLFHSLQKQVEHNVHHGALAATLGKNSGVAKFTKKFIFFNTFYHRYRSITRIVDEVPFSPEGVSGKE